MSNGAEPAVGLVNALIASGERAFKLFHQISGGYWLDHAPEYFLTSHAAAAICSSEKTAAWLEASVSQTRAEAAAVPRGRPHGHDRRNGRYDIVLYWANGTPRAAVEIKSPIWYADTGRLVPDFTRLCKTLSANAESTFQFCVFLYYASVGDPERIFANASQRLRDVIARIDAHAVETATAHDLTALSVPGRIHRGGKEPGAWVVAASVFVRRGGERAFR